MQVAPFQIIPKGPSPLLERGLGRAATGDGNFPFTCIHSFNQDSAQYVEYICICAAGSVHHYIGSWSIWPGLLRLMRISVFSAFQFNSGDHKKQIEVMKSCWEDVGGVIHTHGRSCLQPPSLCLRDHPPCYSILLQKGINGLAKEKLGGRRDCYWMQSLSLSFWHMFKYTFKYPQMSIKRFRCFEKDAVENPPQFLITDIL